MSEQGGPYARWADGEPSSCRSPRVAEIGNIREALGLLNSMVLCGEKHSSVSLEVFAKAKRALDRLLREHDTLQEEMERLKAGACSPCGLCLSHGCTGPSITKKPEPRPAPMPCTDEWEGGCVGPNVCQSCGFCPVHAYEANRQGEGRCIDCVEQKP